MVQLSGKGEFQPPKNKIVHNADTVIMLVYSAMKNIANLKLEYSVWKPATSSDSASGKSKGTRLVSAIAAIKKQRKPTICGTPPWKLIMFHAGRMPQTVRPLCASMICVRLKVFAINTTPTTDMVSASS